MMTWATHRRLRAVLGVEPHARPGRADTDSCLAEASAANRSAAAAALAEIGDTAEMRPALFAALIMPDTPAEDLAEILKAIDAWIRTTVPTASDWEKLHLQASPAVRKAVAAAIELGSPTTRLTSEPSNPLCEHGSSSPIRRAAAKRRLAVEVAGGPHSAAGHDRKRLFSMFPADSAAADRKAGIAPMGVVRSPSDFNESTGGSRRKGPHCRDHKARAAARATASG